MAKNNIKDQRKLEFFHPSMWAKCLDEAEKLSQMERKDYKRIPWKIILTKTTAVDFNERDPLLPAFGLLEEFILNERELFWFLERSRAGKKGHKASFWLFFSKEDAEYFFKLQGEMPLDFRDEEIKALTPPNLPDYLHQVLSEIPDENPNLSLLLVRLTRFMDLVDYYLAEQEDEFKPILRAKLASLALEEAKLLREALTGGEEITSRLKVLHGVVYRFFIERNEVETEYLLKLTHDSEEIRLKGLDLAENRLQKEIA